MDKKEPRPGRCAAAGAAAGLVNGLLGGGGGAVLLVLLRGVCAVPERQAFALCVGVMGPVCAVSAGLYLLGGSVSPGAAWPYLAGGFLGGLLAGRTLEKVPLGLLRRGFGLLLIWSGVRPWL